MVETGDLAGRRFAVTAKGLRLGRSSSNDVHIPDEQLSRNHCFFEIFGEDGIRVTDLASANGTSVNGEQIGGDAVDLHPGDVIEVGSVLLRVVGETPPPPPRPTPAPGPAARGPVDLGFGGRDRVVTPSVTTAAKKKRSPVANILWGVVALLFLAGIVIVLTGVDFERQPARVADVVAQKETLEELVYEKVDADSEKVFRFSMSLANGGILTASVDDVPGENRHLNKSLPLDENAKAKLAEILSDSDFEALDREYVGPESEPPVLKSCTFKVVWSGHCKRVSCVNTVEPDAFARVREKLEAFSKNELGIWAMGHSRAQLLALAESSAETARMRWEDREVEYGNCSAAVRAWREALFYLETVNPKPPQFEDYRKSLRTAEEELERRYRDHRFAADRAINIADWQTAKDELRILIALVPDRDDDRYREASAKLMDVEKRASDRK